MVGACIAGLRTAWELVRQGLEVAVLEDDRIAAGHRPHDGRTAALHTLVYDHLRRGPATHRRAAGGGRRRTRGGTAGRVRHRDRTTLRDRRRGPGERPAQSHPRECLRALTDDLRRRGGTVYEGTRVVGLTEPAVSMHSPNPTCVR
ncbi:FAD-dependent oxidoreductase [Streptomyces sp. NPDC002928]|uniref:FAD-dependent oxidoreductase n=1 Tax=Streptomyces sp. NPDC002928 TaxID=3154440 RepID=UPI0033B19C8E